MHFKEPSTTSHYFKLTTVSHLYLNTDLKKNEGMRIQLLCILYLLASFLYNTIIIPN